MNEAELQGLVGPLSKYNGSKVTPVSSGEGGIWVVQLAPGVEGVVNTRNLVMVERQKPSLPTMPAVLGGGSSGNNRASTKLAVKNICGAGEE
jgi:hypothetical protein